MPGQKHKTHPLIQIIRESLEAQGICKTAGDIILQPWRQGTQKHCSSYIKRWISFCCKQQIDCVSPTISQALDFLVELYESGIGYSGINTARSSLPCQTRKWDIIGLSPYSYEVPQRCFSIKINSNTIHTKMGCWQGTQLPSDNI